MNRISVSLFGSRFAFGLSMIAATVVFCVVLATIAFSSSSEAQTGNGDFLAKEGTPPPGANVPCRPTAKHPYPVILVHGTFETMDQNWSVLSPRLKEKGYCVFALNYGNRGIEDIRDSARELGAFVDKVKRYTGATKVSLVGHSQGGMMPRRWIKSQRAGNEVDDLIGLAPSNYGTELQQVSTSDATAEDFGLPATNLSNPCRACEQQAAGSEFLKRLNRGDDTLGSASYTQIATNDDEIIIPFTRCFLKGKKRTKNLILQEYYPADVPITHQNIYDDPVAQAFVFDALANPGTTKPKRALRDFPINP
jgi:triacylglycerol esterase/lipase EstA (alpha/beta hydrolase family)